MLNIAIVGAGWYGCHIALSLIERGCSVTIFEDNGIFNGAATKNQLRLHLGYHYLRSHSTRQQAKLGYEEFIAKYGFLTEVIPSNLYAVPFEDSLMDYGTVAQILDSEGLPHAQLKEDWNLWSSGFESVFRTEERLISPSKSKLFFEANLSKVLVFRHVTQAEFDNLSRTYDFVIDASYSSRFFNSPAAVFEATLICEFEQLWGQDIFHGLTLIDGELWSIFPTEKNYIRSLSHVRLGPVFQSKNESEVNEFIQASAGKRFDSELEAIRSHVIKHVPKLESSIDTIRTRFLSKKIKSGLVSAKRTTEVVFEENRIFIQPGKIDAVFQSERLVVQHLREVSAL